MVAKNTFVKSGNEKMNRAWVGMFILYSLFSVVLIKLDLSYLGTVDDPFIREFVYNGENRTLIMSYPLSTLLAYLYRMFPEVQWLSWTYFVYMEIIIAIYSFYISRMEDIAVRASMFLFGLIVLLFAWQNITVTLLTLLLIVLAMPLVKRHQILFWTLFLLASLLRDTIIVFVLPLIAVGYAIFFDKNYFSKKRFFAVLFLVAAVLATILSPRFDTEYQKWLSFNFAKGYFKDLHGKDVKNILTDDEKLIANSWYAQDESLLASEKIIAAAGSQLDLVLHRLTHLEPRQILSKLYHHKILIILLLATFYLLFYTQMSKTKKVLYAVYIVGFFTLFFIRDVNRVTYPLIFLWIIFLVTDLWKLKKRREICGVFFTASLLLALDLPIYNQQHKKQKLGYEKELVSLMKKHDLMYEPGLGFPLRINSFFVDAVSQNRLFDENHWISNYILPAGWMCRHPYFYRSHNITWDKKRKYSSYYDFLIGEESAFIGSKERDEVKNARILGMYDRLYGKNGECVHKIKIIDESQHFSVVKVERVCSSG
ncbi:hypothetical protein NNO_0470 [Hydrogenimonas sp.]|nr:hypothetical protein NNO_0470 [Hydrogenimonas sp.]